MPVQQFDHLAAGRSIIIWGGGVLGKLVYRLLTNWGGSSIISGFCDKKACGQPFPIYGRLAMTPAEAIGLAQKGECFLVLAAEDPRQRMAKECEEAGLVVKQHFLPYRALSRPEAVVEISTLPACYAQPSKPAVVDMTQAEYAAVFTKLLADIPGLFHLDLSGWGDPLGHPHLADIVSLTETRVPCTVSTRLHVDADFDGLLNAAPTQLVVIANGYEASYEANNPRMPWSAFVHRLHTLASAWHRLQPDTELRVRYDLYRNNSPADAHCLKVLCDDLRLPFVSTPGYFGPYDTLLEDLCRDTAARAAAAHGDGLAWDLDTAVHLSSIDRHLPCLCQRIFPIITATGVTSLCHVYQEPEVASHYLHIAYDDLLESRHGHPHCRSCQSFGLHRLDIAVLERHHANSFSLPQG